MKKSIKIIGGSLLSVMALTGSYLIGKHDGAKKAKNVKLPIMGDIEIIESSNDILFRFTNKKEIDDAIEDLANRKYAVFQVKVFKDKADA